MTNPSKHLWEEWQLSAYLLGELEPDMAACIAEAAERDPALAQELKDLSSTLADVRQVLTRESEAARDPLILSTLQSKVVAGGQVDPVLSPAVWASASNLPATSTGKRLWSRWEVWASLAGLIVIAVLLVQRQYVPSPLAFDSSAGNSMKDRIEALWNGEASIPTEYASGRTASPVDSVASTNSTAHQVTQSGPQDAADSLVEVSGELVVPGPILNDPTPTASPARALAKQLADKSESRSKLGSASAAPIGGPTALSPSLPAAPGAAGNMMPGSMGGYGGNAGANMGGAMGGMSGGMGMGMGGGMGGGGIAGGMPGMPAGGSVSVDYEAQSSAGLGLGERGYQRNERFSVESEQVVSESRSAPVGDRFNPYRDNSFQAVNDQPLSTFSVDVDTASYTKARQYLSEHHQAPPPASVRIEEFINYFDYQYAGPTGDKPFAAALAVTQCPWQPEHQLVRIALQAKKVEASERPKANLVFLLDVSGSMGEPNKLPLVKESIRLLTYQLTENDRVAMVVYAGAAGCVLESTLGNRQDEILTAIERLNAGGSTNGGQGIQLAYKLARDHFIEGGINRVILCTDGDFNVGVTGTDALVSLVEEQAKSNVFLTVLGYGIGNTNDAMMEQIADRGNGIYGFVDSHQEAQRQMVKQLSGNLMTVAKDVKIQVEFNPAKIKEYRLVGYENRQLKTEDFNNDRKDAGEIGAGHRVTALYELVPVNAKPVTVAEEELRYQSKKKDVEPKPPVAEVVSNEAASHELLAVKLRYKEPEGTESRLLVFPLDDHSVEFEQADSDFRWAAAMAEFGMLLRNSPHKGRANWNGLSERARAAVGVPLDIQRTEALELIRIARGTN